MENNKTMAFLPKEELVHLQEQSKEQKKSKELAEQLKEKLAKAQEVNSIQVSISLSTVLTAPQMST